MVNPIQEPGSPGPKKFRYFAITTVDIFTAEIGRSPNG